MLEPDGWRAASIEIVSLLILYADEEYAAELGRRYRCPSLPIAELEDP